ncbi:MAG TPA: dihydroorotate dehydrogenase [Gemmatimonadaceae bacterium]|nr:dihydroorotate dehydrogenase [Gemmatimonadaceae bacterium]
MTTGTRLRTVVHNLVFQNPIVLAAGTAGYGEELADVVRLNSLGGFVTKAVSLEARGGAPPPRVAEFEGGMVNAVGLANPGLEAVRREHIPWMASHLPATRKIVNVVGFATEEFAAVVAGLENGLDGPQAAAVDAFEINVSCPNVKAGGLEFGADRAALTAVVTGVRRETRRPVFVKLSPTLDSVGDAARVAADAGADGISVVNTIPGLLIDVERRRPVLGFGTGGVSGPAILPVGVLATWKVRKAVPLPILGVGGVSSAEDALQYIMAGAALVGIGTAAMRDPRAPERIVRGLEQWCARHNVNSVEELVGALEWPS